MPRKRKDGPRTKSGRLSRAYTQPDLRDQGTLEGQAKRRSLVGEDGDQTLSYTALGILYAADHLDRYQYAEGLELRRLRHALYGPPWPTSGADLEASEEALANMIMRYNDKLARITPEQREILLNVCAFDQIPNWFYAMKLRLAILPEDIRERTLLIDGLNALLGRRQKKAA